jgi:hypothetical protein
MSLHCSYPHSFSWWVTDLWGGSHGLSERIPCDLPLRL